MVTQILDIAWLGIVTVMAFSLWNDVSFAVRLDVLFVFCGACTLFASLTWFRGNVDNVFRTDPFLERRNRNDFYIMSETTKHQIELVKEKRQQDFLLMDLLPKEFISRLLAVTVRKNEGYLCLYRKK